MTFHSTTRKSQDNGSFHRNGFLSLVAGLVLLFAGAAFAGTSTEPQLAHVGSKDRTPPISKPTAPTGPAAPKRVKDQLSNSAKIQRRITHRYGNPVTVRFTQSVSTNTAIGMYDETTRLIDTRHLKPTSYAQRAYRGVNNLLHAAGNRAFLQANGLSPSRATVDAFRKSLSQLASSTPVRTAVDARNLMFRTMDVASRQLGVRPTTVALEFVYGAAESLDKYSTFLPDENGQQPSASLEDHVVGIGVEIKPHDSGVLVVKPLQGGPADKAGIQRGDIILSVNGRNLKGQSLDYAVDLIGGPQGSPVLLVIERDGRRLSPLSLIRQRVEIHSVSEVRMLDSQNGVGYIKLDTFAKTSSEEMDKALWDLYRRGMKTLVFDLRGNPGGLLTTAISLSDKFLPSGSIVSTRGRNSVDNTSERASFERTWKMPLVVLVDGNSASASEIFAAAIQDNQRGLVVGRHSYGKGTVQTHFPLSSVAGNLKLTTAKFYSPNGREMAGSGVEPDVTVDVDSNEVVSLADDRDIQAAVNIAGGNRLQELASSVSRMSAGNQFDLHRGN
jgi:carboxyl-terminal processing protease